MPAETTTGVPTPQRLFFALWPSEAERRELVRAQSEMPGRHIAPENLHLTLAFLGSIHPSRLPDLQKSAAAVRGEPIELQLTRLEHWEKQSIAALVPDPIPPALTKLIADLRQQLTSAGFDVETRPFIPHVTLSRNVTSRIDRLLLPPIRWRVQHFVLAESTPDAAGKSRYRSLHIWPLQLR